MKAYIKSYQGKGEDMTQSAFNLRAIGDVVWNLDALSGELIAELGIKRVREAVAVARYYRPSFFDGERLGVLHSEYKGAYIRNISLLLHSGSHGTQNMGYCGIGHAK